jgi:UDP-N-acetylmuramoylalanine--D-glutamate ligase
LSSFQIDLTPSLGPTAGVLLYFSPDHLDRHVTVVHYAAVKEGLVMAAVVSFVGADDDVSRAIAMRRLNTGAPHFQGCRRARADQVTRAIGCSGRVKAAAA